MTQKILDAAITGNIQDELQRLGLKCHTSQNLAWFTDRPFCNKSIIVPCKNNKLDEPYVTILGYKTACKVYERLKKIEDCKQNVET